MKSSFCAALLASVAGVAAARPQIVASPAPRLPVPNPPVRTKQCVVKTNGDGSDDSEYILAAFNDCNNGGHVVFSENATYTIGTAMDWTFLKSIDIGEPSHPTPHAEHNTCVSPAGHGCVALPALAGAYLLSLFQETAAGQLAFSSRVSKGTAR